MDDEPSNLLFMIAAPNDGDVHLEVLSRLMTLLMDEDFRAKLLAADTTLTETFLRMGIDELSVSPGFVLKVRDAVRKLDLSKSLCS